MILYIRKKTSISVTDAKFNKNPLIRLWDFQLFQNAVTNLSYWYDLPVLPTNHSFSLWWLLRLPAGQCPSPPRPVTAETPNFNSPFDWPMAIEQSRSQSGGLSNLGHSAGTSLPLPDLWRRPSNWLKSGVVLITTLLTEHWEQWISGVIDCINVYAQEGKHFEHLIWTFWLFWLMSTAQEYHDLWVMLFKKNSYFSKVKAGFYQTT